MTNKSKEIPRQRKFLGITEPIASVDYKKKWIITIGVLMIYQVFNAVLIIPAARSGWGWLITPRIMTPRLQEFDFYALVRIITGSTYGSLAELGILPLVLGGVLVKSLSKFNIIKIDSNNPEDRIRYETWKRNISIGITLGLLALLINSGLYGTDLPLLTQLAIFIQLGIAGIFIILLVEIIDKGWGFGSGVSLFIAGSVLYHIFHSLLDPSNILEGPNAVTSAKGLVWALLYWITEEGPINAFISLFFRFNTNPSHNLYLASVSIFSFMLAGIIFVLIVSIEEGYWKVPAKGTFPSLETKINYVIPLLMTTIILQIFRIICKFIWDTNGRENAISILVDIFGQYRLDRHLEIYRPINGIAYFITPFNLIETIFYDPLSTLIRGIVYGGIFLGLYISTSKFWTHLNISKTNQKTSEGMQNNCLYIGLLAVGTEVLNPLGIGVGIVIGTLIIMNYYQLLVNSKEPRFITFDLEYEYTPKEGRKIQNSLTARKFWSSIILIGLGAWILRFMVYVLLGREM